MMLQLYAISFSLFIQGGNSFNGSFVGKYPTADVRVRVWRMCDFPAADFTSANVYTVSVLGNKSYYYSSEDFFLYKTTVDKRTIHHFTPKNELLTGSWFFDYCTPSAF